jgi:hypothetical protein
MPAMSIVALRWSSNLVDSELHHPCHAQMVRGRVLSTVHRLMAGPMTGQLGPSPAPGGRTSYENVAVKALQSEVVSVSPARTGFPLTRVLGTPAVSLLGVAQLP